MSGTDLPYLLTRLYSVSITRLPRSAIFSNGEKTVTFADISNSAEQSLTHQSQQRKVFTTTLSDDITLSEIINGV